MSQVWLIETSTCCSHFSNNCHVAVKHSSLRVSDKVRVISVCDRLRDVRPDPLQQVVLRWCVLIPHHQQVHPPPLPVSPGVHDVEAIRCGELVGVRVKAWCCGALTLAAEMEGCVVTSFLVSMYILCRLPVEECVSPPLHHPGVDAHTLQHLVQHLRQMVEESRY